MHLTGKKKQIATGVLLLTSAGLMSATAALSASAADDPIGALSGTHTRADLDPLNNAAADGVATVTVNGRKVDVSVDAKRMLRGMPHAMHIHFGRSARHECPTVRDDSNADHRLSTAEGLPAYGPVKASLTTRGDTSPRSTLAVTRFPKARNGQIHYDRSFGIGGRLATAIENGKAVVVIHGIDYNHNGRYDFSAGPSELDPSLPAEATDPAACGVLHRDSVLP